MDKLVSIGIPVKNGFTNKSGDDINLEKVVNSILAQSYQNIEIIISNNCSTDKTNIFLDNNEVKSRKDNMTKQILAHMYC